MDEPLKDGPHGGNFTHAEQRTTTADDNWNAASAKRIEVRLAIRSDRSEQNGHLAEAVRMVALNEVTDGRRNEVSFVGNGVEYKELDEPARPKSTHFLLVALV